MLECGVEMVWPEVMLRRFGYGSVNSSVGQMGGGDCSQLDAARLAAMLSASGIDLQVTLCPGICLT